MRESREEPIHPMTREVYDSLPEQAIIMHRTDGPVLIVKGEPVRHRLNEEVWSSERIASFNLFQLAVGSHVLRAMAIGSISGWTNAGANPANHPETVMSGQN